MTFWDKLFWEIHPWTILSFVIIEWTHNVTWNPISQSSLTLWDHHPIWDLSLAHVIMWSVNAFLRVLCSWEMLDHPLLSLEFCLICIWGKCHLECISVNHLTAWTFVQLSAWVPISPSPSSIWKESFRRRTALAVPLVLPLPDPMHMSTLFLSQLISICEAYALTPGRKRTSHGPLPWILSRTHILWSSDNHHHDMSAPRSLGPGIPHRTHPQIMCL